MDVRQIDNTWCIVIEPKAGAVKDDHRRTVPLHDHLLEQGFLEFAQKKKGRERLFYDEKPGVDASEKNPQYGEVAGRLGRWARETLKVTAKDVDPNHGWRHRFKASYASIRGMRLSFEKFLKSRSIEARQSWKGAVAAEADVPARAAEAEARSATTSN